MSKADEVRRLIDVHGFGPIEAHEAVTQGDVPEKLTLTQRMEQ